MAHISKTRLRLPLAALLLLSLSACGGGGDDDDGFFILTNQYVVAATAAPDFTSGAHSFGSVEPPRDIANGLDASGSDLIIVANGDEFFRIERFGSDTVSKYLASNPATPVWKFSTDDPGSSLSNVHDMVFANDQRAFLIRYGATTAWVVDPSVSSEGDFKIDEIDLSAYGGDDGIPEMDSAVIVGNKLFIAMQRFEDSFTRLNTAYVAVFNVNTGAEIETNASDADSLKGIPLPVTNPQEMIYDPDSGLIYVLAQGKLACGFCNPATPAQYNGGIISIDPRNFTVNLVVDDGDDSNHPYGNLSGLAIVDATTGYFIGYNAFQDNSLFRFNPSTGAVAAGTVAGLANQDLTTLAADRDAFLWVGKADANNPGLVVIDSVTDSAIEQVNTLLNPQSIAFGEVELP